MSQGAFVIVGYRRDSGGTTHSIRIQPETLALRIGGTLNLSSSFARISPSALADPTRSRAGIYARMLHFKFAPGQTPEGYSPGGTHSLPWLIDNGAFRGVVRGSTGSYLGRPVVFVGKSLEVVR